VTADPFLAATARVRAGGLIAYPTETTYGLGADACSARAVSALQAWKGRDAHQPLSILVTGTQMCQVLGCDLGPAALRLVASFWPGPLTIVVRCRKAFAPGVAGPGGTLGLRCSSHPLAHALAVRLASEGLGPVTATSFNASGAQPARTRHEALALCTASRVAPLLLDLPSLDEPCGGASTVVDATCDAPRILREGVISAAALRSVFRAAGEGRTHDD
jgi:L-threonylcarbamoyladenylate synthase